MNNFEQIVEEKSTKVIKELFFHVGLAKTGSTFLQNRFFHKLKGIRYIHTSKFYRYNSIIKQSNENQLLFSREFDRQFFDETLKIAEKYPYAKIIIVLRSNEKWIASQYRRYVKNGGSRSFENFINIKTNKGIWKIEEALFLPKLKFLTRHFNNPPLILFYEEFKENPHKVFRKIADYTNSDYDKNSINLKPKHKSYSDKQLLFIRKLTRKFYKKDPYEFTDKEVTWLKYRSRWFLLHIFLYLAKFIPMRFEEELISKKQLLEYESFYRKDWEQCLEFTKENSVF
ncbi:MAG: hypothetical protein GXO80_12750 [Chlorobi bacterium]|nr:hypothetical protein [Chlorobiota bacterium]